MKLLQHLVTGASATTLLSRSRVLSPAGRVVQLLGSLQQALSEEEGIEKEAFEKFDCASNDLKGELSTSIEEANVLLQELGATILSSRTDSAKHAANLKAAQESLASSNGELADAKEVFQSEHEELIKIVQELQQGIVDVDAAVNRLQSARQPSGQSLLSKGDSVDVAKVVNRLSSLAAFAPAAYDKVQAVLKEQSLLQGGSAGLDKIVGTLNQMASGFASDLNTKSTDIADAKVGFMQTTSALQRQIEKTQKNIASLQGALASAEQTLAMSREEQTATKQKNEADNATLKQVTDTQEAKNKEYAARGADRNEEIAAIAKAMEILGKTSGMTAVLLQKTKSSVNEKRVSAAAVLRELAMKTGSHTLATIALKAGQEPEGQTFDNLDGTKEDRFTDLLEMLKTEIAESQAAMKQDTKDRDACLSKSANLEGSNIESQTNANRIGNDIENLAVKQEALNEALEKSGKEIAAKKEAIELAKQNSLEQADALQQEIEKVRTDSGLLQEAIDSLASYYSLLQISDDVEEGGSKIPEDPFAGEREGQKRGGKGVVQILTILLDDTSKNLARLEGDLKSNQDNFRALRAELDESVAALESMKMEQESALQSAQSATRQAEESLSQNGEEAAALAAEHEAHTQNCAWIARHYDVRRSENEENIEQIRKAIEVLSSGVGDGDVDVA